MVKFDFNAYSLLSFKNVIVYVGTRNVRCLVYVYKTLDCQVEY